MFAKESKKSSTGMFLPFLGSYHRNYKGYHEFVEVVDGKRHIRRVYQGTLYTLEMSPLQQRIRKAVYCLLWIVAVLLYTVSATRQYEGARGIITAIGQFGAGLSFLACAVGIVNYLFTGPDRTEEEWHSSNGSILFWCAVTGGFLIIGAGTAVVQWIKGSPEIKPVLFVVMLTSISSAVVIFLWFYLERKVRYIQKESDGEVPEEAIAL